MDFMWLYKEFHSKQYASKVRTDSGWKPEFYQDKHDRAIRKTIALTNKLNKENFEELSKHFHSLYITSPESLDKMISELYKKALLDRAYIKLYIALAQYLGNAIKSDKPIKLITAEALRTFENQDERRIDRLDNIKFVGELTRLEVIKTSYIVQTVIPSLLDTNQIEELCLLVDVLFPILETFLKGKLTLVLEQMYTTAETNKIKFLVQDLQDRLKKEKKPSTFKWGKQNKNKPSSSRKQTTFEETNKKNSSLKNRSVKPWQPIHLRSTTPIDEQPKEAPTKDDKCLLNKVKEILLEFIDTDDRDEVKLCFDEIRSTSGNIPLLSFKVILGQRVAVQKDLSILMKSLFEDKYFQSEEVINCIDAIEQEISTLEEDYPLASKLMHDWKSAQIKLP